MAQRKVATTVYITPKQDELLKLLSAKTGVSAAEYIRRGIDLVLVNEKHILPEQLLIPEMATESKN